MLFQQRNRQNILYAGSNSGLLHAIDAKTGEEKWGFIPPFIAGKLPTMINKDLDGKLLDGMLRHSMVMTYKHY